jgi:hypothetical protein
MEGDGPTVFAHACRLGLEGIVSKGDCRGAIVGLEPVPIDAERDRARAVPRSTSVPSKQRPYSLISRSVSACSNAQLAANTRWAAGRARSRRTVTTHQLTESQQATTSPKTPAATSQPSDGQWDCNFIWGCRSPLREAGIGEVSNGYGLHPRRRGRRVG